MNEMTPESVSARDPPRFRVMMAVAFVAVVALACVVAAALLLWRAAEEHADLRQQSLTDAVALSNALDQEVAAMNYLLKGLSTSPALRAGDYKSFYDQLTATPVPEGSWLILHDLEGQVLNTLRPFGAALPRHSDYPTSPVARVREQGWSVSGRVISLLRPGATLVGLGLRVDSAGQPMKHFLTTIVSDVRLRQIMTELRLPGITHAGAFDRDAQPLFTPAEGSLVSDRAISERLRSRLVGLERARVVESLLDAADERGNPVLVGLRRSALTDWTSGRCDPGALPERAHANRSRPRLPSARRRARGSRHDEASRAADKRPHGLNDGSEAGAGRAFRAIAGAGRAGAHRARAARYDRSASRRRHARVDADHRRRRRKSGGSESVRRGRGILGQGPEGASDLQLSASSPQSRARRAQCNAERVRRRPLPADRARSGCASLRRGRLSPVRPPADAPAGRAGGAGERAATRHGIAREPRPPATGRARASARQRQWQRHRRRDGRRRAAAVRRRYPRHARARLKQFGGELRIKTKSSGTTLIAVVPLTAQGREVKDLVELADSRSHRSNDSAVTAEA